MVGRDILSKGLPFVEVNKQVLPFLIFFSVVFYSASYFWNQFGLSKDNRAFIASSTSSLVHGFPAALISFSQLRKAWPIKVDAVNSRENVQLLIYTLAYMMADTSLYLLPYSPTEFLFITHHLVAMAFVVTTITRGRGAISCIVMLCFGECTSIWQNSWYFCTTLYGRFKWLDAYSVLVSYTYPGSYILVRSIVGPPAVIFLCWKLGRSRLIPKPEKTLWISICLVSLAGSQLWSASLFKTFFWERQDNPALYAHKLE